MLSKILERFLPSSKTRARTEIVNKILSFVKFCKVDGDYLEFGVFKGATFAEFYKQAKSRRLDGMRFCAFDSFEGLPEVKGVDREHPQFAQGEYSASLERFKESLSRSKINPDDVLIVPGWFQKTLNQETKYTLGLTKAAIVWIDCDLYESTIPVLDFISDLLVDGSVLVFDDWFAFKGNPNRGEQKAFREWLAQHPEITVSEFQKFFWHGNSFIVHKKG